MSETNETGKRGREEDEVVEAPPTKATKSEDNETAPEDNAAEASELTTEAKQKTEVAADVNGVEANGTAFVVDRTGEETEGQTDVTNEQETAPAEESAPASGTAETISPKYEQPTQNAPPPLPVATLPPPAVNPTVQATVVNPDQIVEERGEIPALYVGKVIGKVRLRKWNHLHPPLSFMSHHHSPCFHHQSSLILCL